MNTGSLFIFLILSLVIVFVSRKSLFNFRRHGFYRFLSWECILWLLSNNYKFWFKDPLSPNQLISWLLLVYSMYPAIAGFIQLKKARRSDEDRDMEGLYEFEKTGELVQTGIYKFIRHPLYSSLLFLTWGICFKNPEWGLIMISLVSSLFLYITARLDEKECIAYFGEKYVLYKKHTTMFVPYVL